MTDQAAPDEGPLVLHVIASDAGFHLVTRATLDAAEAAQVAAEAVDVCEDHELDDEIDDHFLHTVQTRMLDDVPADVLDEFGAVRSPMFVDYRIGVIDPDRLDEMITALEARCFTVRRA